MLYNKSQGKSHWHALIYTSIASLYRKTNLDYAVKLTRNAAYVGLYSTITASVNVIEYKQ